MCAERDIGRAVGDDRRRRSRPGASAPSRDFDPTLYLYDALPGGVGLAPEIFQRFGELARRRRRRSARCGCENGCPQLLGPLPRYHVGLRAAAQRLLGLLQEGVLS